MANPLRIGVLGLTHDHVWSNTQELTQLKDARLVAVADPNEPLLDRARKEFNCPTYVDYQALLDAEQVDAVYLFSDNTTCVELVEMAAERKLHVLVEKPMAATLAGADRMLSAVRNAGVRLMINWPFAWWPQMQHAIGMVQRGALGRLWEVKYRSAHEGPRELGCTTHFCEWLYDGEINGAGAYMDYCCYGAALASATLGLPSRVTGMLGRFVKEDIPVDDNGIIVMTYPRAMAVSEGSWTQIGHPTAYVTTFYGTEGLLLLEPSHQGRLIHATMKEPEGKPMPVAEQAANMRTASAHFVHAITSGEEFFVLCRDRVCRDAQEILEAGLRSARRGHEVALPLVPY